MNSIKKFSPLGRRLMINSLSFISAILLLLLITLGVAVRNYYYNTVSEAITRYAQSYETLSVESASNYAASARRLAETFTMKTGVEIQFLDRAGRVIVSTSGFLPSAEEPYGDYAAAKAGDGTGSWTGNLSTGEKVMAACTLLTDYGSGSNGAVRCVTSLTLVDRRIWLILIVAAAVAAVTVLVIISLRIRLILISVISLIVIVRIIISRI